MRYRELLLAATILSGMASAAHAMDGVVASIKPVHSLVAAVMGNTGRPKLIVDGAGSPHTYSLKPSQARMLEDAKLVFWIGHDLEAFLEKPLETLSGGAQVVALSKADGMKLLELREGGTFEAHDHGHEGHGDHDHDHDHEADHERAEHAGREHEEGHAHEHEAHDDHAEKHADHDHDGEDHGGHHHGDEVDMHVWLDPQNAAVMAHAIAEALAKADPHNAATYMANADALEVSLSGLVDEIAATVAPVKDQPFIVFHDAYHYFENRFGLHAAGSITVSPEVMPGAERISEVRAKIAELGSVCVFAEPQFEPKILSVLTEGTDIRTGALDPLGADLPAGPDLYPTLMRDMAREFRHCLGG